MSPSLILVTFLLQMSVGMCISVAILPTRLVDKHFFRSINFWAMLFTAMALFFRHRSSFELSPIFGPDANPSESVRHLSTVGYYAFLLVCAQLWYRIRFRDIDVTRLELLPPALIGLAAVLLDAANYIPSFPPLWAEWLMVGWHFVSASMLLGGFLAGMLFGHWYLTNEDMPKRLLVNMSYIMIGVLVFRIMGTGLTLWLTDQLIKPDSDFLYRFTALEGHGIFFWQRILVGLGIPAVVVGLIWSTAKIGSNQSATGIMYVAIAFVFIGELAARYLFLLSSIPL